jgi:protein O-GlcNAc transferase
LTAVQSKPDFWQAHYQLVSKDEIEEAEKQFLEVIRYRPDFIEAHLDLETILMKQRKSDQALNEFRAVLQFDPENISAQQQIAAVETMHSH